MAEDDREYKKTDIPSLGGLERSQRLIWSCYVEARFAPGDCYERRSFFPRNCAVNCAVSCFRPSTYLTCSHDPPFLLLIVSLPQERNLVAIQNLHKGIKTIKLI
jgi:hypothetical protein